VKHLICPLPENSKCRNAIKATKGGIFADTLLNEVLEPDLWKKRIIQLVYLIDIQ